jgi:hypothetical protein
VLGGGFGFEPAHDAGGGGRCSGGHRDNISKRGSRNKSRKECEFWFPRRREGAKDFSLLALSHGGSR